MTDLFEQSYKLPFGYTVTFSHMGTKDGQLIAAFDPDVPQFNNKKAHGKFIEKYNEARRDFMTTIATAIDGSILDLSYDEDGNILACPIHPKEKQ